MATDQQQLAISPFTELGTSESFCLRSKLMGFETLQDIFDTPAEQLLAKADFTYSWLGELISLTKCYKLLYKLQPMPGNTAF